MAYNYNNSKKKIWKISLNAPITLCFAAICFGALILNMVTGGLSNRVLFMNYRSSLKAPLTYVRFFTHIFGHADWNHFISNMCYILLLGPLLEERHSPGRIMLVIFITAFITGLVHFIFFPGTALLGASGVAFAFILLSSVTGFKDREIPITFILVAVLYLGQQVIDGIFVKDNISNMSHIIGGLIGGACGIAFSKNRK